MADSKNSIVDLKKYLGAGFSTYPDRPVSSSEMTEFWNELTDEEKQEFKNTELK